MKSCFKNLNAPNSNPSTGRIKKQNRPEKRNPEFLANFEPASVEEIRYLILSSTDSSCPLDVILTKLLKSFIDAFVTPITHLINLSLGRSFSYFLQACCCCFIA